jgi:ABC-type Na+ efflux pump permease subunit
MKNGYVKSSPRFFRLIIRSFVVCVAGLLLLAALFPAPLQEAANPARTPNPAKSAWFLLWIQELVSWSRVMIYPVVAVALLFVFLPWLPGNIALERAQWFPRQQWPVTLATIIGMAAVVVLTVVALLFRGANWSLLF